MKKNKIYDRAEVLSAMYELKRQKFYDIGCSINNDDGSLIMWCTESDSGLIPDIEIDDTESYLTSNNMPQIVKSFGWREDGVYWWIFD